MDKLQVFFLITSAIVLFLYGLNHFSQEMETIGKERLHGKLNNMVQQQALPLETAGFLIMGSNIGTTGTALIASIGMNIDAKRAAHANLMFNILGVIVFWPLLIPLLTLLKSHFDNAGQIAAFIFLNTLFEAPRFIISLQNRLILNLGIQGLERSFMRNSQRSTALVKENLFFREIKLKIDRI